MTLDFIKNNAFAFDQRRSGGFDQQVSLCFERSEMDKQTVIQIFKMIMKDHSSNLRYLSRVGVLPTLAFNQKTVGTSFAQNDSPMNVMRIVWICYHSVTRLMSGPLTITLLHGRKGKSCQNECTLV
jgi:CRISPR/Cas system type I-B associated protein Csh2 (Cas7 group RAMP superfamily)